MHSISIAASSGCRALGAMIASKRHSIGVHFGTATNFPLILRLQIKYKYNNKYIFYINARKNTNKYSIGVQIGTEATSLPLVGKRI